MFPWLKRLYATYGSLESQEILKLKDTLLKEIKRLVEISSEETANIIDIWLPKQ